MRNIHLHLYPCETKGVIKNCIVNFGGVIINRICLSQIVSLSTKLLVSEVSFHYAHDCIFSIFKMLYVSKMYLSKSKK